MCRSQVFDCISYMISRVFFICFIVLNRKIKRETERFSYKNLIFVAPIFDVSSFAFSRIGLSSFDFSSLLFRFLICKRYNLLSIAIWSISTSINWTRLIERCKLYIIYANSCVVWTVRINLFDNRSYKFVAKCSKINACTYLSMYESNKIVFTRTRNFIF